MKMNINNIELEIIKKFINKNRQERFIYEFGSSKKRKKVIWKLISSNVFNQRCLHLIEYMSCDEMEEYLFQLSGAKDVYFIGEDYIGDLPLKQAARRAHTGEICIIYCGNGIGYYQGEQEIGKPPRYLLLQID